jgi:hypothetical protein
MHHASLEEFLPKLTPAHPFQFALRLGEASTVVYAPVPVDRQYAHDQAEVYVVVRGRGRLLNGPIDIEFATGDLLFVDVGVQHRFIDFTPDLVVWAVFFGPSILGDHRFVVPSSGAPERAGTLSIDQKQGDDKNRGEDIFRAVWRPATGQSLAGLGFGRDRYLSFARTVGEKIGLVEYRRENNQLHARWTHSNLGGQIGLGDGVAQGEIPDGFIGSYTIRYKNSAGDPIYGPLRLEIVGEGLVRRLKWVSEEMKFEGIGIEADGVLVAAWEAPGTDLELVDYSSPLPGRPVLTGRTVQTGSSVIGVEDVNLAPFSF